MTTRWPCAQVLRVTLVDTPGYGDKLDSERAVSPIHEYAISRMRNRLRAERSVRGADPIDTKAHPDEQLHCLLYFVPPHRLLSTDRLFLQRMQRLMPVIVVIAKADTLSDAELAAQRKVSLQDVEVGASSDAVAAFLQLGLTGLAKRVKFKATSSSKITSKEMS